MQPTIPACQPLEHPLNRRRAILDLTEIPNLARPATFSDGYRVLPLRDIERHKGSLSILSNGPSSVREARLGLPEQPSLSMARRGRTTGFTPGT